MRHESGKPDFWNDNTLATTTLKKISVLEKEIELLMTLDLAKSDIGVLLEFAESGDINLNEIILELENFVSKVKDLELKMILGNPKDLQDAIITIHPGAGGTESQDWAQMLRRMYSKWIEKKKCKFEIISEHRGEEAGIKSSTLKIIGSHMFGWLKLESGVHRLVRISPFDSGSRRHTSFASVWVYPVVDDNIKINIKENEIRIDTYRSSGAGGQHVNTTDSAVRITHLPTNIVVQCQNERSQHKNKATCFNMLKARLYNYEIQKKEEASENLTKSKTDIGWGHQIRSYVLQPYQLVKDLRNDYEDTNPSNVLNGDIDSFLENSLFKLKVNKH